MRKTLIVLLTLLLVASSIFAGERSKGYIGLSGGYQMEDKEIIHSVFSEKHDVESFALNIDGAYFGKEGKSGYLFTASLLFPQKMKWDSGDVTDTYDYRSFGVEVLKAFRFEPMNNLYVDLGLGLGYELLIPDLKHDDDYDQYFNTVALASKLAANYSFTEHFAVRAGLGMTIPFFTYYTSHYTGNGDHGDDTFDFMYGVTAQPFIGAAYTF